MSESLDKNLLIKSRSGNGVSLKHSPKMNIAIFTEHFYSGFIKRDLETINLWIDKVGSAYIRVDIVDDDDNLVFWVPPLAYGLTSRDHAHLIEETVEFKQTKETHSNAAESRLANFFNRNIMLERPPEVDINQWKLILEHYGDSAPIPDPDSGEDEDSDEEW